MAGCITNSTESCREPGLHYSYSWKMWRKKQKTYTVSLQKPEARIAIQRSKFNFSQSDVTSSGVLFCLTKSQKLTEKHLISCWDTTILLILETKKKKHENVKTESLNLKPRRILTPQVKKSVQQHK